MPVRYCVLSEVTCSGCNGVGFARYQPWEKMPPSVLARLKSALRRTPITCERCGGRGKQFIRTPLREALRDLGVLVPDIED